MDHSLFQYLLRLGDSTLILSHRVSELTGHGPALEEDLAMTNIALDLLGQARMWLTLAGDVEGRQRDEDQLAYLRDAPEYRNYLLVEQANGNYAHVMARQFFFDVWHYYLLQGLLASADERVAAIAEKSLKEVTYHVRRSGDVLVRLGDGTPQSHHYMQEAVNLVWRFVGELFLDDAVIQDLAERRIAPAHAGLWQPWLAYVEHTLAEATLTMPAPEQANHPAYRGGTTGRHTEALGYILAEMQHLQRTYPGATW